MISDLRQSLDRLDREIGFSPSAREEKSRKRTHIFKEFVRREHHRLRYEHEAGATGRHIVYQWTAAVDALVIEAYRAVILEHEHLAGDCAILAIGGYGREHLNVRSDVDIMFLFRDQVPSDSPVVTEVLQLLWDLDFDLGHSTRTINEALDFAESNDVAKTAMLDARFLAGFEPLHHNLVTQFRARFLGDRGRQFARLKAQQLLERRESRGMYAQVLEPNLKESTGGLRDVHTIQWIMNARKGSGQLDALVEHHVLARRDLQSLETSVDLLWRARNELHFLQKRKHDRLDFDKQPLVAKALRYSDTSEMLDVECFMRDYYMAAREIERITDSVCHELTGRVSRTVRAFDFLRRQNLEDGAVLVRGKIVPPTRKGDFFRDDPARLMSIFRDKQVHGATLSKTFARSVHENLDLVDDGFRRDPRIAGKFFEILSDPTRLGEVLRRMHYTGLLGAYIPEFGRLTCLVQHDYYHAYTADEHSIVTVQKLAALDDPADTSQRARLYRDIPDKRVLHMATLFHDAGKSGGHGHAERGAEMAEEFTERLGMGAEDRDHIAFLIAHHLELSQVSERRDLSDAAMIDQLASRFSDVQTLDMLYLLTWADMNATQSKPVSQWKVELLALLHAQLRAAILQREGEMPGLIGLLESPDRFEQNLAEIVGEETAKRHMTGLPRRYSLIQPLDEAAVHARRADQLNDGNNVLIDVIGEDGPGASVTVYTRDRAYLLSDICGVLSVNELNILSADAYTRSDGIIVDIFNVQGIEADAQARRRQIEAMESTFRSVWSGEAVIEDLIARHRRRWARRKVKAAQSAPKIVFDNRISNLFTVVDVFVVDRNGLLYDLSRTLSEGGLNIHMARIGTDADRAVDAFYVTNGDGHKLREEQDMERIRTTLLTALRTGAR
jgi:[protein-PII] uridylyltransferase